MIACLSVCFQDLSRLDSSFRGSGSGDEEGTGQGNLSLSAGRQETYVYDVRTSMPLCLSVLECYHFITVRLKTTG